MDAPLDFQTLKESVQSALVATVKTVNRLAAEDLDFQKTANPATGKRLERSVGRILALSQKVLKAEAKSVGTQAPRITDTDDLELNWSKIVDIVDCIFEKADSALDECTGLAKRRDLGQNESVASKKSASLQANLRNANIRKPQLSFEVQPDTQSQSPWKPILTKKPHATVPLEESLVLADYNGSMEWRHPYETEILNSEFPDRAFQHAEPTPYKPLETTQATWVSTYEEVLEMLEELKKADEIAVDLEHHDYRTYVGLTCLMQISTRTHDWIVDTLQPWRHKLEVLNEVFTNPSIIKVLHGAHMDVQWLQRDLGLYLNGYFDTYYACEVLGYPQRSLAYLLKKFASFDADKKYQLADWRRRPIPNEMMFYAQSDTHFLLYIYDMMRNELIKHSDNSRPDMNLMREVIRKSKERALTRYDQLTFDPSTGDGNRGWLNPILRQMWPMNGSQFAVYRALWEWRDKKARDCDENPVYVLCNQALGDIARDIPDQRSAFEALVPRRASIARESLSDLWLLVQEAVKKGESGPTLMQFINSTERKVDIRTTGSAGLSTDAKPEEEFTGSRLDVSQLFGNMLLSSSWEDGEETGTPDDFIQLPWQRLHPDMLSIMNEQTRVAMQQEEDKKLSDEVIHVSSTTPVKPKDVEFTLKAGMKRKAPEPDASTGEHIESPVADEAEAAQEGAASNASEDNEQGDDENSIAQRKRAKKLARKAAQREKLKAARGIGEGEGEAEGGEDEEKDKNEDEEVFDYDTAKSVMYGNVDKTVESHKKSFNPYAKASLDRPIKGARRAPPMKGGRSVTFRKELILYAFFCLGDNQIKIDLDKMMQLAGFKTRESARTSWNSVRRKLIAGRDHIGILVGGSERKRATPLTPRKRKSAVASAAFSDNDNSAPSTPSSATRSEDDSSRGLFTGSKKPDNGANVKVATTPTKGKRNWTKVKATNEYNKVGEETPLEGWDDSSDDYTATARASAAGIKGELKAT
ncbi:Exosome complex exonuclease rrp6 [Ceratocystis platani]|uniref:Exosome complex exonuclease rrp6 n=1 Tax=Ceratocystis fimbriata f. sp. platani TaxID=88771 RepID=A0A0F8D3S5_CERFI|nr:Exosome complex exonuclease rrp6 [Ceratocystis platani]